LPSGTHRRIHAAFINPELGTIRAGAPVNRLPLSRTLLLTAAASAVSTGLFALEASDDDVKLGLKLNLQARADVSDAQNATGADYAVAGSTNGANDPVDFSMRRARLGFQGSFKGDYRFAYIVRADNQDKSAAGASRGLETHVAYLERVWKTSEGKIEHSLRAGLDYAFFNSASMWGGGGLLPTARATDNGGFLAPRGVGVGYRLTAPYVTWGVDVQNNQSDGAATGDGLTTTTRVQVTPEGEWKIGKFVETWAGKAGKGVLVAAEYGVNANSPAATAIASGYAAEVLAHYNGLSALAEFRRAETQGDIKREAWLVQAGYAFPLGETKQVIEPAVRYTSIDRNTDVEETASFSAWNTTAGGAEYGGSGTQIEAGVNWYLHGPGHKVQLSYIDWSAEEGDADAQIIRAQWALSF
jgi:hypothetical protein